MNAWALDLFGTTGVLWSEALLPVVIEHTERGVPIKKVPPQGADKVLTINKYLRYLKKDEFYCSIFFCCCWVGFKCD